MKICIAHNSMQYGVLDTNFKQMMYVSEGFVKKHNVVGLCKSGRINWVDHWEYIPYLDEVIVESKETRHIDDVPIDTVEIFDDYGIELKTKSNLGQCYVCTPFYIMDIFSNFCEWQTFDTDEIVIPLRESRIILEFSKKVNFITAKLKLTGDWIDYTQPQHKLLQYYEERYLK